MIVGIVSGMVMQRNNANVAEILIYPESEIKSANYIKEDSTLKEVVLEKADNGAYILSGIPTGGPYTVNIDGKAYTDIYVGDVWLLGGQSNMEGVGELTNEDLKAKVEDHIRAFYMNDEWGTADHILMHDLWNAKDKVHRKLMGENAIPPVGPRVRCVGPGLFFAQSMYEFEQVPQGVICSAHGGTSMDQWSPAGKELGGDESLYGAMYRRFVHNGSRVRGLFWYQGCSDASPELSKVFEEKMINLVDSLRKDFVKDLPVIQVQISRVAGVGNVDIDSSWSKIREIQRTLHEKVDNLDTVYTIPYELSDAIHLSSNSQKVVGKNAAELMYNLIHGYDAKNSKPGIRLEGLKMKMNSFNPMCTDIVVTFSNLHGKLKADPIAMGFELLAGDNKIGDCIYNVTLLEDTAIVRVNLPLDEIIRNDMKIGYGYGINPRCNITDESGFSIPAFGPIELKDKE